jgi:hypothetical protein
MGAVITIILVGYEPFLQAILTQYGELDSSTSGESANTGRCERLDIGTTVSMGASGIKPMRAPIWVTRPNLGITGAAYGGFQNALEAKDSLVQFNCATGNCTFGTFASLAGK